MGDTFAGDHALQSKAPYLNTQDFLDKIDQNLKKALA